MENIMIKVQINLNKLKNIRNMLEIRINFRSRNSHRREIFNRYNINLTPDVYE